MSKQKEPTAIVNKKALFNYEKLDSYNAGIILGGTEVKAVREGKVNLSDSYCFFRAGELWIKNLHISEYKFGSYTNHEPLRLRKLLLQKRELKRLQAKIKEKGLTIIPYKLYFNERSIVKIEIFLAKGKKVYDKRESLKAKDQKRDIERVKKRFS
ncbi:MAG: SsrA-binding protein SmpB [Chitinophagales bacterium]|nr:SsrA-binding protein SmpB [Chitinophagales bacterium]